MFDVCALYHFARFDDPATLAGPLRDLCAAEGITGTLLLAPEGINGTVAGPRAGLERLLAHVRALPGCAGLEAKFSTASAPPFGRMKVRLKREIVTMGQPDVDPRAAVGHYLSPEAWNELIREGDVAVIDTRNDYEVAIGSFEGAVDPGTKSFREFPDWWEANKARFHNKRIAMFCTGGIRCEKSTNYLLPRRHGRGAKPLARRLFRFRRAGERGARAAGRAACAVPGLPPSAGTGRSGAPGLRGRGLLPSLRGGIH